MKIRAEYPRPQFVRNEWECLNGEWTFHIVRRASFQKYQEDSSENINSTGFKDKIIVPFAPETALSGVSSDEIINCIFYHRKLNVPLEWRGRRIILHFGAVFYHSEIYINSKLVGFHDGGSSSFELDITDFITFGEDDLVVKVESCLVDGSIPSGKQSCFVHSYACYYQRTTGIWQSVWMEPVSRYGLKRVKMSWAEQDGCIQFTPEYFSINSDLRLRVNIKYGNDETSREVTVVDGVLFSVKIENPVLWRPGNVALYDIRFDVFDGDTVIDNVVSYFGLRTIEIIGNKVYLNGKVLFQRLVLDQGFYPESNWTAPSDQALENDIRLSIAAGFNGARLHQKVFEERYLYHADRLGYLLWEESPSWGLDYNNPGLPARNFLSEWREIVTRDINHPSVIAWTPLNETFLFAVPLVHQRLHKEVYELTKALDKTRPVNDSSGYIHYITDLWTVHLYEQNPEKFSKMIFKNNDDIFRCYPDIEPRYSGQPYFVDEFGGIKWDPMTQYIPELSFSQNLDSWGYGESPSDIEAYYNRLSELVRILISKDFISGYCYTQLTDVEQEKNGIYYYNRKPKFDMKRILEIFSRIPDWADF